MSTNKDLGHDEELERRDRDYYDHHLSDVPTLERILFEAVEVMEDSKIPYAVIGGFAVRSFGRPRVTHDIDFFVKPEDANKTLEALEKKGFVTQKRDPYWLFKAWKENVLVDVIFKSSGDIYFDEEAQSHVRRALFLNKYLNSISPEDFLVIKAAAHQEHNPHHWHDALAVLKQGNLDWEYLLRRAKHAPRRVLALLIYGQSNDIAVPNDLIKKLYRSIFESPTYVPETIIHPYRKEIVSGSNLEIYEESPVYTKGRIIEALTTDERIAEHDIKVYVGDHQIVAKGEVFSKEQRDAVNEVIHGIAPDFEFKNLIEVRILKGPEASEAIS